MTQELMLTTDDNPFDPRTEWDDWIRFDTDNGHHTNAVIARIARTSDELSDEENQQEINNAIMALVTLRPEFYRKLEI